MAVVTVDSKDSKVKLPALMVSKHNKEVILAISRKKTDGEHGLVGFVVKKGEGGGMSIFGGGSNDIGHYSESWRESSFELYDEQVTLENEKEEKDAAHDD